MTSKKDKPINLSSAEIVNAIDRYMSHLSKVKYDENKIMTTKALIDVFRDGLGIEPHNLMSSEAGILCFDLMICKNPLEKVKKQEFYTLFSQGDIMKKKQQLADVYQYYLNHDNDDSHIDTMLQICYSDQYAEEVKGGFYLDFYEKGFCSLYTLSNKKQRFRVALDENRIASCTELLPNNDDMEMDKATLESVKNSIDKKIEEYCSEVTGNSEYQNYVDVFLDKKTIGKKNLTNREVLKNVYLISIINELAVPGLKYLYFIPIPFPNESQIGHFVLSTKKKLQTKQINRFKMLSFVLMFPLAQAVISTHYNRRVQREAIKSAVSAIMARNFKHNHGSHVLNQLASDDPNAFVPKGNYKRPNVTGKPHNDENVELQRAFFLKYENHRMGYHCDLSYGAPMLVENRSVFKEIFLELDRNCALLDHISGLEENFKYSICFERMAQDGTSKVIGYDNDFKIAIPDGLVGTHAFYNIIENVVRNTAKHHNKEVDEFMFTVRFSDMPTPGREELCEEAKSLYCVEIFDNVEMEQQEAEDLVELQTNNANLPIMKDGRLRSTALGVAEMEISACFLRQLDTYLIDSDEYEVDNLKGYYNKYGKYNLIKPIALEMNGKYRFGYRFFVRRPQEVLIVSDAFELNQPEQGIRSMKVDEFLASLDHDAIYPEDFVVIHRSKIIDEETIHPYRTSLTTRVLFVDDFKWVDADEENAVLTECWNMWRQQNEKQWTVNEIVSSIAPPEPNRALMEHHGDDLPEGILEKNYGYIDILSSDAVRRFPYYSGEGLDTKIIKRKSDFPSK